MRSVSGLALAVVVSSLGCGGSAASKKADPAEAAAGAMTLYDKDGNGELAGPELDAAPAIKSAMAQVDADKNGAVTRQELETRLVALKNGSSAVSVSVTVVGAKGPLVGAEVTLTPEPYMGDGLPAYSGATIEGGLCELKSGDAPAHSLPSGLYQARVVHAATGTDKTLGCEVSDTLGNRLTLKL